MAFFAVGYYNIFDGNGHIVAKDLPEDAAVQGFVHGLAFDEHPGLGGIVEDEQVEIKEKDVEPVILKVRTRMMDEITVEDKINEEVRTILTQHQDEMRRAGISYQEMFKKVKGQLARDRKLILR